MNYGILRRKTVVGVLATVLVAGTGVAAAAAGTSGAAHPATAKAATATKAKSKATPLPICWNTKTGKMHVHSAKFRCAKSEKPKVLGVGTTGKSGAKGKTGKTGARGLAGAVGAQGLQGVQGLAGAAGAGITGVQLVHSSVTTMLGGTSGDTTAWCPTGTTLLSGGVDTDGLPAVSSIPTTDGTKWGWQVGIQNLTLLAHTVTVYALCATVG